MTITINANGLSIVHKDSGAEATASLPDVCLTKVGKPIVPIPYSNSAKSSDLVGGSTSVFADGGNSIALQGSKFSCSVGDAAGDKKGIVSGTIEGEAEFITASPNVLIEGKGVARQSDHMTMNNGNTICTGVQSPSVTVEENGELLHSLEVSVRYPNGRRLKNAEVTLLDEHGTLVASGALDIKGFCQINGLKPGQVQLRVKESSDAYTLHPARQFNAYYSEALDDDAFFDIAKKGQLGFWQPRHIDSQILSWGGLGGDDYFHDIVFTETMRHFRYRHSDNAYHVDKLSECLMSWVGLPLAHTTEALLAYSMPFLFEEGDILSVILRLAPYETANRLFAYMRSRGEGDPQCYLRDYNWVWAQKTTAEAFDALLNKIAGRLSFLHHEADKRKLITADTFDKQLSTLNAYIKKLPDLIADVFVKLEKRSAMLLSQTQSVAVTQTEDRLYATEAEGIQAVVNTTRTIDVVEPYLHELPSQISNITPIYPVRYGYANFFDTIMPAQAPPSMATMSSAKRLKDTGGYLLRLLREGWIYIKEESDEGNAPFHIFKYAQTPTPTGVIEKFEKYVFTNQENAQGGLTLDTSSGSTFYPFAFVTPKAKKISIVYSEHEWSAAIIDALNSDESLRAKSMQSVDLTSPSGDFSLEASQDNLTTLVEDYRPNDKKWLAIESRQAQKVGLDVLTTQISYHLAAKGIVDKMQKSHTDNLNGKLIALYDPVGRQSDLAHAVTFLTLLEKNSEAQKRYPNSIGQIVQSFLDHSDAEIKKAAQENIDEQALKKFFKASKKDAIEYQARREALLDVYGAFAYQDLADGQIGSLDTYLKMFFDIESDSVAFPEQEAEKIAALIANIFEGVSASEQGQVALVEMINSAYESDQSLQDSSNIYHLVTELIEKMLLQCQGQVDWSEVIRKTPLCFGKLWAEARAVSIYGSKLTLKVTHKLSANALSAIVGSFMPTFLDKVYGVEYTGEKIRVTQQELTKILAKHIDSAGKNTRILAKAESNLKWAKTLFDKPSSFQEDISYHYELSEVKVTKHVNDNGTFEKGNPATVMRELGRLGDTIITGWSWVDNLGTIYDILAQSNYDKADPLQRSGFLYQESNIIAKLAAITADSADFSRAALFYANKSLTTQKMSVIAQHVLPKINSSQLELEKLIKAKAISRLIALANIAGVIVAFGDVADDCKSGNMGSLTGNVSIGIASAIFAGGAYLELSGLVGFITGGVGFLFLLAGVFLTMRYGKNAFENLLFRCFWGASDNYSFWYFEKGGYLDIDTRQELAAKKGDEKEFQVAYQLETQEFLNFLMQPKLTITKTSEIWSSKKNFNYQFVLPNFVWQVSEIVGSIQNTALDNYQGMAYINQIDTFESKATEAFTKALNHALNDPAKREIKDGALHLNVEVELEESPAQNLTLYWYYKPTPDITVPKRMLALDGEIKKNYIGMQDDKPMDNE